MLSRDAACRSLGGESLPLAAGLALLLMPPRAWHALGAGKGLLNQRPPHASLLHPHPFLLTQPAPADSPKAESGGTFLLVPASRGFRASVQTGLARNSSRAGTEIYLCTHSPTPGLGTEWASGILVGWLNWRLRYWCQNPFWVPWLRQEGAHPSSPSPPGAGAIKGKIPLPAYPRGLAIGVPSQVDQTDSSS